MTCNNSIDKILKSILAVENKKIPKSHRFSLEVYENIKDKIDFVDNEFVILAKATEYHKEDRYPNPNYSLPPRDETKEVLEFAEKLFDKVCNILKINKDELV